MSSFSPREDRLEAVVLEYLQAVDAREAPDPRQVIARHPDLAAELSDFFKGEAVVAACVRSSRAVGCPTDSFFPILFIMLAS